MKSKLLLIALSLACAACVAEAPADVPAAQPAAVDPAPSASAPAPSAPELNPLVPPVAGDAAAQAVEPVMGSRPPAGVAPSEATATVSADGRITPAALRAALDRGEAVLVDVRGDADWAFRRAKEAIHIPYNDLFARSVELPHQKLIALYCT